MVHESSGDQVAVDALVSVSFRLGGSVKRRVLLRLQEVYRDCLGVVPVVTAWRRIPISGVTL